MGDIITNALRRLSRQKLATAGGITGYAFCCCFIALIALMLQYDVQSKIATVRPMGAKFLAYAPLKSDDVMSKIASDSVNEFFFTEPAVRTKLLPSSLAEKIALMPEVSAVTPFLLFRMKQGQDGHLFSLGGIKLDTEKDVYALRSTMVSEKDIIKGAFLKPGDRNVVVLDKSYAELWNLKPGSYVNVADSLYPVIGVVSSHARTARADIYMNMADAENAINRRLVGEKLKNEANIFLVAAKSGEMTAPGMKKTEDLLKNEINASMVNCSLHIVDYMGFSRETLKYVLILSCFFVFIFAVNGQFAAVNERFHDIAVLKAIGWKNIHVFTQIIVESFIIAVCGGILGTFLGFLIFPLIAAYVGASPNVNYEVMNIPGLCLAVFVLISLTSAVSGGIASIKAVRIRPADVLRN